MEYQRQFDEIQAGFALNTAKLLWQYETMTKRMSPVPTGDDEPRYEGTLAVCILQALLTQCTELLDYMESESITREFFEHDIEIAPHSWGLSQAVVTVDKFPGPLTLRRVLTHVRNAVSHPSFRSPDSLFTPTGFTTTGSAPGEPIVTYRFTDSPWVKDGKRYYKGRLPGATESEVRGKAKQFDREWGSDGYLTVLTAPDSSFDLGRDGDVYWPIFEIELPLLRLRQLAIELANYLAHKTLRDWDGRTIQRFVPSVAA